MQTTDVVDAVPYGHSLINGIKMEAEITKSDLRALVEVAFAKNSWPTAISLQKKIVPLSPNC